MTHHTITTSIGDQLIERKHEIANNIFSELLAAYPTIYVEARRIESLPYFEQLIELIGEGLLRGENNLDKSSQWGKEVGRLASGQGVPLHMSISKSSLYKKVILENIVLHNEATISKDILLQITNDIDHTFTTMISAFCEAYSEYAEEQLKISEEKYLSLSTPVVPIFSDLAVLPLIGQVDEVRGEMMAEHVLLECKKLSIHKLIIDLSGVYEVNPLFQQGIMKLIDSLKLLGIEPILSGMRPEMSIEFVQMGINISSLKIYQSLNKAVENH
ncbi:MULTISPECIES: STAS domain-containing protein [Rossellomorea]|jgi:rsbT co-antagonist protein RsbR|uniref:STAS domain-containing protein n=1 Tax=Rossellomorea TaxID=2837508 RepID=UPI0011E8F729|nr:MULTISPECIES: STAS domain-containing protein [Rossellomorea]MDT9024144.1 STAS domain-containing protein [Rossellomorea sp. YC4-1]TYS91348.1 STAS domain-containing protein [Rossellomorea aquimaris]